MHESYWGIAESPFGVQSRIRHFFASPTHDEALARLGFLVDAGHSLGILTGHEGAGRSTVLEVFARDLRRQGRAVCLTNLLGLDERSLLWTLAVGLGANPRTADDSFSLWRRIHDRLQQHAIEGRTTVLLLDDADQASHEVLVQILRLLKTHAQGVTVILVVESSRLARLGGDLLQLSQLRIRLDPWNATDIRDYLQSSLERVGCDRPVFEDSAAVRLQELTDGTPRWVSQLADLALLASATQDSATIDGQVIEAVYQELSATFAEDPAEATY